MFRPQLSLCLCMLALAGCAVGMRPALIVEEHLLSAPPDLSTDRLVFHFADGDQQAILARTQRYKDFLSQTAEQNRRALETFGYILRPAASPAGGYSADTFDIYRGDHVIARGAIAMQPLSLNASETDFIGRVDLFDGTYLFTPRRFEKLAWPPGRQPYLYVGDQLLSVELTDVSHGVSRLHAFLGDVAAYASDFKNVSTYASFDGPWSYGNHWALILLDARPDGQGGWFPLARLIQDSQDVNSAMGYEQTFEFAVLNGRPFYFYQKDAAIGISFDGQQLPNRYDEVPHYDCCTGALLNPGHSMNMTWFFARRGPSWYYVEAYLPRSDAP